MMRIEQILDAIEVTGEVPLWLAVELSAPGVLRRTWARADDRQRIRWLRARPGALEPLVRELARVVGFSEETVEDARYMVSDWKRFCEAAATRFSASGATPPPQVDTLRTRSHGWFALGAMFVGCPAREIVDYSIEAGMDLQRLHELVLAAGPPTVEETIAYAASILPVGGRR